jgi:hypothetical protein
MKSLKLTLEKNISAIKSHMRNLVNLLVKDLGGVKIDEKIEGKKSRDSVN